MSGSFKERSVIAGKEGDGADKIAEGTGSGVCEGLASNDKSGAEAREEMADGVRGALRDEVEEGAGEGDKGCGGVQARAGKRCNADEGILHFKSVAIAQDGCEVARRVVDDGRGGCLVQAANGTSEERRPRGKRNDQHGNGVCHQIERVAGGQDITQAARDLLHIAVAVGAVQTMCKVASDRLVGRLGCTAQT